MPMTRCTWFVVEHPLAKFIGRVKHFDHQDPLTLAREAWGSRAQYRPGLLWYERDEALTVLDIDMSGVAHEKGPVTSGPRDAFDFY